jgi:hypothetical protein
MARNMGQWLQLHCVKKGRWQRFNKTLLEPIYTLESWSELVDFVKFTIYSGGNSQAEKGEEYRFLKSLAIKIL